MRVLFCNYEYPPLGGGGGVMNALIAEELARRHQVTVLTSRALDLPPETTDARGVRIIRVPVLFRREEAVANLPSMLMFMVTATWRGRRLLAAERFDLINTQFVLPTGPVGDALARNGRLPNVLTVYGGDIYDPSKFTSPHRHALLRVWVRRLLRRADVVVGESENVLRYVRRFYTPELESELIPLGIRRPTAEAATRSRYGFAADEVLLVTVGRLVPRKALDQLVTLLESFANLPLRLLIIGTGPEQSSLEALARERRVTDRVRFMGYVGDDEKFAILKMCDVYVSTSQHEGFGLVFLEAMASSLPVVCYDEGGQTDFLEDGVTGFLVPLNDRERFAARCGRLIQDEAARKTFGRNNLQRVEPYYIENCALAYERLFQAAIAKAGQGDS